MGRAQFNNARFLGAARDIAHESRPAGVTGGSVTQRLGAPTGSFYYRFLHATYSWASYGWPPRWRSRRILWRRLKLATALPRRFNPVWVRAHLDDARLLLLYHRDDFVQGEWPEALKRGVGLQAQRVDACYEKFAPIPSAKPIPSNSGFRLLLADVPKAAVIRTCAGVSHRRRSSTS